MTDRALPDPPRDDPFDERAALEEIERTRNEIERYRAERRAKEEEFARFIAASRQGAIAPAPAPRPSIPPDVPSEDRVGRGPKPEAIPEPTALPPVPAALDTKHAPARRRSSIGTLAVIGAVVLAGAIYVALTQRSPAEPSSPPAATPTTTPAPAPPVEQAPAPAPAAPAAPQSSPDEAVLTTTRPAWVRVIADGVPIVERELAAGARVPFIARKSIVIRTGDAGAVRLAIGGVDRGALGKIGEVVTRRFDVTTR